MLFQARLFFPLEAFLAPRAVVVNFFLLQLPCNIAERRLVAGGVDVGVRAGDAHGGVVVAEDAFYACGGGGEGDEA